MIFSASTCYSGYNAVKALASFGLRWVIQILTNGDWLNWISLKLIFTLNVLKICISASFYPQSWGQSSITQKIHYKTNQMNFYEQMIKDWGAIYKKHACECCWVTKLESKIGASLQTHHFTPTVALRQLSCRGIMAVSHWEQQNRPE